MNAVVLTRDEHLQRIDTAAAELAAALKDALDADVGQALVLPRLMLAFRQSFGDLPAGIVLPGMAS